MGQNFRYLKRQGLFYFISIGRAWIEVREKGGEKRTKIGQIMILQISNVIGINIIFLACLVS